jgi:hypothetical protein
VLLLESKEVILLLKAAAGMSLAASINSVLPLLFTATNVGVFLPLLFPLLVAAALVDGILLGSGENMMLAKFDCCLVVELL